MKKVDKIVCLWADGTWCFEEEVAAILAAGIHADDADQYVRDLEHFFAYDDQLMHYTRLEVHI